VAGGTHEVVGPRFANVHPASAVVGGIQRRGLSAHPPNHGQTIGHLPMTLPDEAAALNTWVGIRDGSTSTGVVFAVEVNGLEVARRRMLPGRWEELTVDLSQWKGSPIVLSLITDSDGPYSFDWAHWGEPQIEPKSQRQDGR
jgi:hypothetical protein